MKYKINNSWTTKEIYRSLLKDKVISNMTNREFGYIVKTLNTFLKNRILEGLPIKLPLQLGKIELLKHSRKLEFKDGKLSTNLPIDWKETNRLWREDEIEREKKTLVRFNLSVIYRIYYNKKNAKFNNKAFYKFTPFRSFKIQVKDKLINKELDSVYEVY